MAGLDKAGGRERHGIARIISISALLASLPGSPPDKPAPLTGKLTSRYATSSLASLPGTGPLQGVLAKSEGRAVGRGQGWGPQQAAGPEETLPWGENSVLWLFGDNGGPLKR